MDKELVTLLRDHHLEDRKDSFDNMGIITFSHMAHTKRLSLKENHLFTDAELVHFDNLRDVCIKKINEQKAQKRPDPAPVPAVVKEMVTETGAKRTTPETSVPIEQPPSIAPRQTAPLETPQRPNMEVRQPATMPIQPLSIQQPSQAGTASMLVQRSDQFRYHSVGQQFPPLESYTFHQPNPSIQPQSGYYQEPNISEQPHGMPSMREHSMSIDQLPLSHHLPNIPYNQAYHAMPSQMNYHYKYDYQPQSCPVYVGNPNAPFYQQNVGPQNRPPHVIPQYERSSDGHTSIDHIPNTRSTHTPVLEEFYNIDDSKEFRGLGLIFTNEIFDNHPEGKRNGAKQDENNFEHIYKIMGLEIRKFYDLTTAEIKGKLEEISQTDLTQHAMLCIGFSTHGEQGDVLYGKDFKKFSLYNEVVSLFKPDKCRTLNGKPKIVLVQACRGDARGEIQADSLEVQRPYTLESDFLIAHSAVSGYQAYRHTETGSWFVSQLRTAFDMFAEKCHLIEILTFANQLVVKQSIRTGEEVEYTQTCQLESTLTKKLYTPSRLFLHNTP